MRDKFFIGLIICIFLGCKNENKMIKERQVTVKPKSQYEHIVKSLKSDTVNLDSLFLPDAISKIYSDSKWIKDIGDDCINSIEFTSEKLLLSYNCELGEFSEGQYSIENDTIYYLKYGYPDEMSSQAKVIREYKMIIVDNNLYFVQTKSVDGGKWKSNLKNNSYPFYTRQ